MILIKACFDIFFAVLTHPVSTQPAEDVSVVAWNRQVQHILASASPSGKAVVWDLRKNEPIIKISDHSNRVSLRINNSKPYQSVHMSARCQSSRERLASLRRHRLPFRRQQLLTFKLPQLCNGNQHSKIFEHACCENISCHTVLY